MATTAKELSAWYAELDKNDNGFTTIAERQGNINIAALQGSPTLNSNLKDYFINPPIPKVKKINLDICIKSEIDVEFGGSPTYNRIGKLLSISEDGYHYINGQGNSKTCQVRENHIHYNKGYTYCPIPDGLEIVLHYANGDTDVTNKYMIKDWTIRKAISSITGFEVLNVAEGWTYE